MQNPLGQALPVPTAEQRSCVPGWRAGRAGTIAGLKILYLTTHKLFTIIKRKEKSIYYVTPRHNIKEKKYNTKQNNKDNELPLYCKCLSIGGYRFPSGRPFDFLLDYNNILLFQKTYIRYVYYCLGKWCLKRTIADPNRFGFSQQLKLVGDNNKKCVCVCLCVCASEILRYQILTLITCATGTQISILTSPLSKEARILYRPLWF